MHTKSVFLFTRDLRLDDNTGLLKALEESKEVQLCFIFNPQQLEYNEYFSEKAAGFMRARLTHLATLVPITFLHGDIAASLKKLQPFDALYMNKDYTPFAKKRESSIQEFCTVHAIQFNCYHDALLTTPEQVRKNDGTPYTVFTPFYNKAKLLPIAQPKRNTRTNYAPSTHHEFPKLPDSQERGITEYKQLAEYETERDILALDATSHLSVHLKFGTLSVRKAYHGIQKQLGDHPLLRQLYWRDFFTHIAYHFPHVFGNSFRKQYDTIAWNQNKDHFKAWCEGKTGFPIVDAGMRELNATGYMHNRARMITSSFLIKDLHIDWRKGEKYFAQKLIDYDPSLNNGNWQWAASTGCDAVPYFRIFNPWRQQKRFDPECTYIKKWIPELAHLSAKDIHALEEKPISGYPSQIVNHKEEASNAKLMYKVASQCTK